MDTLNAAAEHSTTPTPDLPLEVVAAGALVADNPNLHPPILEGLLRQAETMNVIAASKAGKSWLAWSLAISTAVGRLWLDRFAVEQGRVLYIDAELHRSTISKRITAVADALQVPRDLAFANIDVLPMRGRLRDIFQLMGFFAGIQPGAYRLVVLDALYRLIPEGIDENSNSAMTRVYNRIDQYADATRAGVVIVHHSSKGVQGHKLVTDVGAGAGALARATDSHLILRQHTEDDAVSVEAAVRSFRPLDPFCLRWSFPLWLPADELDPADVRLEVKRRRKVEDADAPAVEPWTPERVALELVGEGVQDRAIVLARAKAVGLSERMASDLVRLAIERGLVHRWPKGRTTAILLARTAPPAVPGDGVQK
jgi:hypothetical protein